MNSPKAETYFPALTGVRAVAAYMVFLHHSNPFSEKTFGKPIHDFFQEFHVGVTLFFVLSGFLIAYRNYDDTQFNFRNYMVNRIARIYPMFFILTTLTFLVFKLGFADEINADRFTPLSYFLNISFLRGFSDRLKFSGIEQGWSLTVEETFYILAPLFFILIRWKKINLVLLPAAIILFGLATVILFKGGGEYGFMKSNEFLFNYTFFGRCTEFFIGIALAIYVKQRQGTAATQYFTWLGAVMIILCIYSISLFKGEADFGIRHPAGKLINLVFLPLFGIAVFYYGLLTEKTIISRILSTRLFILLGKSSFVFYLIHKGVLYDLLWMFSANHMIVFVCLVLISIYLYQYDEEPLNRFIRKKFRRQEIGVQEIS